MRTVLILVLLPVALAVALAGCHGVDHAAPTVASPTLALPSSNGPTSTIEIPPPP